jgi:mannosyltransferase OCH1-like enzyme
MKYYEKYKNNDEKIPRLIIQTWKNNDIPSKYINSIRSIKRYNPNYKFMFFTDKDIDKFIKEEYPQYYSTYKRLPVIIQKIDFFRYIAVYHYGGIYFDLDMTGLYPLDNILKYECVFPVDTILTPVKCASNRFKKYCDKGYDYILGQYAFGAKPKHPFIKALIDGINDNIDKYIEEFKTNQTLHYVYASTGPDYVMNIYLDYKDKNNIHVLEYPVAQYFGKYAKHDHFGTWKN